MTFPYPKQALAGGSGMEIFPAEGPGGRVRQATDEHVETSTHHTAGWIK